MRTNNRHSILPFKKNCSFAPTRKNKPSMQNIGQSIGKYLFPIILIFIGLVLLLFSSGQNTWFLLGGAGILIVGILGILYIKGLISGVVSAILTVVVAIGAVVFGYMDYRVIDNKLQYEKKRARIGEAVIQRLKDIREAQVAYEKEYEKYAPSFDSLIHFLKNEKITIIKRLGSLPDTVATDEQAMELGLITPMPEGMTDQEAIAQGLIVRDTLEVDVKGYVFDEDYMKKHKTKLYIDSLPYVPFSDDKFKMQTDFIDAGGVRTPVFLVEVPEPFDPRDKYQVGSLTKASTSGNWTE